MSDYNDGYDKDLEGLRLMQKQLDLSLGLRYMTAGKSILTFVNKITGVHYTYRISCSNMVFRDRYYVSVLSGPNNTKDYSYIGVIEFKNNNYQFLFAPSHIRVQCTMSISAPSVQAWFKIWAKLSNLGYVYPENNTVKLTSDFGYAYKFPKLELAEHIIKKYNLDNCIIEKYAETRKYKEKNTWKAEVIKDYWCIHTKVILENFEMWRSTHCLRCGRLLTHPKSVENDLGPWCIKQFNNGY